MQEEEQCFSTSSLIFLLRTLLRLLSYSHLPFFFLFYLSLLSLPLASPHSLTFLFLFLGASTMLSHLFVKHQQRDSLLICIVVFSIRRRISFVFFFRKGENSRVPFMLRYVSFFFLFSFINFFLLRRLYPSFP